MMILSHNQEVKDVNNKDSKETTNNRGSIQALALNKSDNVAVSLFDLKRGDSATVQYPNGERISVTICEDIPKYHKFALCDIAKNENIIKYGYPIGQSKEAIKKGIHVHIHNTLSEMEMKTYG